MALVAAGYGVGAGVIAIVHSLASGTLGFRGVFALALVPLALLPLIARWWWSPTGSPWPRPRRTPDTGARAVARPYRAPPADRGRWPSPSRSSPARPTASSSCSRRTSCTCRARDLGHGGRRRRRRPRPGCWPDAGWPTGWAGADRRAGHGGDGVDRPSSPTPAPRRRCWSATCSGCSPPRSSRPAAGALANELFPTAVRASVAGWSLAAGVLGAVVGLVAFGAVAHSGHPFAMAGLLTFLPVVPAVGLFWLLPETRGREPEDLWPER